jgi:hypothetical protein
MECLPVRPCIAGRMKWPARRLTYARCAKFPKALCQREDWPFFIRRWLKPAQVWTA